METIIVLLIFLTGVIFFIIIDINFRKLIKYDIFKNYKYLMGFSWFRIIHVKKEIFRLLPQDLQELIKEGRRIALIIYLFL